MIALATVPNAAQPPTALEPIETTLYQWSMSAYCYKVRLAAAFKGVRFQERIFGMKELNAAKRATGLGKVPVIQTGDEWVTDSTAILAWLDARYRARPLYPEGREADCALLEDWADEALAAAVEPWLWLGEGRLAPLNKFCADEQESALSRFIMRAIRPVQKRVWTQRARRHGGLEATRALIGKQLGLIEDRLGSDDYLFGDAPSAADFAVAAQLMNLVRFGAVHVFDDAPLALAFVRRVGRLLPDADWLEEA
jgi:glutathione S-transferase